MFEHLRQIEEWLNSLRRTLLDEPDTDLDDDDGGDDDDDYGQDQDSKPKGGALKKLKTSRVVGDQDLVGEKAQTRVLSRDLQIARESQRDRPTDTVQSRLINRIKAAQLESDDIQRRLDHAALNAAQRAELTKTINEQQKQIESYKLLLETSRLQEITAVKQRVQKRYTQLLKRQRDRDFTHFESILSRI